MADGTCAARCPDDPGPQSLATPNDLFRKSNDVNFQMLPLIASGPLKDMLASTAVSSPILSIGGPLQPERRQSSRRRTRT